MKVKVDMMLHLTTSARHSSVYKSLCMCVNAGMCAALLLEVGELTGEQQEETGSKR